MSNLGYFKVSGKLCEDRLSARSTSARASVPRPDDDTNWRAVSWLRAKRVRVVREAGLFGGPRQTIAPED
eukprot:10508-Pelagococcus_subviridis.AAC.4